MGDFSISSEKKAASLQALRYSKQMFFCLFFVLLIIQIKAVGNREAYVQCFITSLISASRLSLLLSKRHFFFSSAVRDAFRGSQGGESTDVNLWGFFGAFRAPEAFMPTAKWELWFFTVTTT